MTDQEPAGAEPGQAVARAHDIVRTAHQEADAAIDAIQDPQLGKVQAVLEGKTLLRRLPTPAEVANMGGLHGIGPGQRDDRDGCQPDVRHRRRVAGTARMRLAELS